ncbi:MAG: SpoIIIAH-like family protein [Clostridia bacterium]
MKFVKKSKLALLSVALMLSVAGYINYKYNPDREKNLGQTLYVNGKDSFTYDSVSIYSEEEKKLKEVENEKAAVIANQDKQKNVTESTIAVFKYDRDNMFSELSENYTQIIKNTNTSPDKINEYQKKLNELIQKKNLITMVENVIKSKGVEDVVIIPTNNDNINVVVKSKEELKPELIAQIQQILVDQLGASANKISITCKA